MKILAIIGVRFNSNYSNVNFGKKNKQHSVPSSIKAIPVAVMLAMSPITNAGEIMNTAQVVVNNYNDDYHDETDAIHYIYTQTPDVTKIIPKQYKSAFNHSAKKVRYHYVTPPPIGEAYVFDSKDHNMVSVINSYGNYKTINSSGHKDTFFKFVAYNIDLKKLEVNAIFCNDENGESHIKFKYYIQGPGWIYSIDKASNIGYLEPNNDNIYEEKNDIKIEVTKDFYNELKEQFGSEVEKVKNVIYE